MIARASSSGKYMVKYKQNLIVGQYIPGIDFLRALAIILVVWWHSSVVAYSDDAGDNIMINYYFIISILGTSGVTLFFIISGFLITGILIETSNDRKCLQNFYIRRSLRIFPVYYASICLFLLLSALYIKDYELNTYVFSSFLYLQNWVPLFDLNYIPFNSVDNQFIGHFWSLAVEEQFYLIWPIFFLFIYRRLNSLSIIAVLIFIILYSTLLRWYMIYNGVDWAIPYSLTATRIDSLIMGGLLVYVLKKNYNIIDIISKYAPKLILILFTSIIFISFRGGMFDSNVSYIVTLSSLLYICLFVYFLRNNEKSLIYNLSSNRYFRRIAKVSYGLYIFHLPVMILIQEFLGGYNYSFWVNHLLLLIVGGIISYLLAEVSYNYFEKPILKLKNKYASYDNFNNSVISETTAK